MKWWNRDWHEEDRSYEPKRQVHNRASWLRPHEIGSFPSFKNGREVQYESINERLFYYLLELDSRTVRYYPQPVNITMSGRDRNGTLKTWSHVPDVLVFREGSIPTLFEVKESPNELPESFQRVIKYCQKFAVQQGWNYRVVYPKKMNSEVIHNLNFLVGYLKLRLGYSTWISAVMEQATYMQPCSIHDLSETFGSTTNPLFIVPVIYHLIARGQLAIHLNQKLDQFSIVSVPPSHDGLFEQITQWF